MDKIVTKNVLKNDADAGKQYSLGKILGLWIAAAAPMGLLAWIVFPLLRDRVDMHPGIFLWMLMIVGLMWQVVLSLTMDSPRIAESRGCARDSNSRIIGSSRVSVSGVSGECFRCLVSTDDENPLVLFRSIV